MSGWLNSGRRAPSSFWAKCGSRDPPRAERWRLAGELEAGKKARAGETSATQGFMGSHHDSKSRSEAMNRAVHNSDPPGSAFCSWNSGSWRASFPMSMHWDHEPRHLSCASVFQHRVLEDTEKASSSVLCALQNSVLNPAVHGKFRPPIWDAHRGHEPRDWSAKLQLRAFLVRAELELCAPVHG